MKHLIYELNSIKIKLLRALVLHQTFFVCSFSKGWTWQWVQLSLEHRTCIWKWQSMKKIFIQCHHFEEFFSILTSLNDTISLAAHWHIKGFTKFNVKFLKFLTLWNHPVEHLIYELNSIKIKLLRALVLHQTFFVCSFSKGWTWQWVQLSLEHRTCIWKWQSMKKIYSLI